MYPKFSDIINDFFGTSLNLPIQTYGLFVALAFVAGGWIVYLELKRKEKEQIIFPFEKEVKAKGKPGRELVTVHPSQLTTSIILVAAIFGILGSKLFDVVEHLDELVKDPLGTLFSFSGLAFYGGLITAAFAVGRIGCQLAGDGCWGVVNLAPKAEWMGFLPDWMWAFNYPNNVLNAGNLIPGCDGPHCHVLGQPVFPTPFYETMIALLFFGVLWSIRKKIRIHGYLFSIYLVLNGTERIFIEQLRVNIRYDFLGMKVTQAAVIAVGLMVVGTAGFFYFHWRNKNGPLVSINE
jgi:phosphatidylglycerol:prolipoprotein diacylglycerol transferase